MKTHPMEVVYYTDEAGIGQLVNAVYKSIEPGFQVPIVTEYDELEIVLASILKATPDKATEVQDYNAVTCRLGYEEHENPPNYPHIDVWCHDIAVNLNAHGTFPVTMGVPSEHQALDLGPMELRRARNIRRGVARPGSLTVFSEGGYDWLLPTIHWFNRPKPMEAMWARFIQAAPERQISETDKEKINELFRLVNKKHPSSA